MIITHQITMELNRSRPLEPVCVMQDDRYSRDVCILLTLDDDPWPIPDGARAVIHFEKADGTGGNYDTLPDGTAACSFSGNALTVSLAPQTCTVPGAVKLTVTLILGEKVISTFAFYLSVQRAVGLQAVSENYFKVAGALADSGWAPNMYLGTDEEGKVVTKAGGSGSSTGDSISIWSCKKFVAFGTSITWACSSYDGGYLEVVKSRNGFASFLNAGVSGAAMANNTANGNGIHHKIRNTDISGYDLVLIECTTNDFKLNVSLGEVGIMGDTNFDTDTFCGALRDSIEYILSTDPTKQILLITDPQRNNASYDVNYTNSAGHKLLDYVNALHKIAVLYGLPVCDWYRNSGFNALTLGTYTTDGLHPNATGYRVLGNVTASCVANMYSTCVYVEGEGGSSGDDTGDTGDSGETETTEAFVDVVTAYSTGYIDSTGAITTSYATNWRVTDYIAVSEGEIYKYIGNTAVGTSPLSNVWGYDADKNPVQELLAKGDNSEEGAEFTIPAGTSYIRCGYYYKNANGYRIQKLDENAEIVDADTSKIVANVYINDSNVQTALSGNYLYDEFIDITAVMPMYTPVYDDWGSIRLAEYDENKNFIKRWYGYFMPGELASKVSSNCKYIKFGDNVSGSVVNTLQLVTIS